jgi:hypothetical protein
MREYRLDYGIIKRATEGNAEAVGEVLKHFDGYINTVARQKIYDGAGNTVGIPREDIQNRLKGKLAYAVLKFKADRIV